MLVHAMKMMIIITVKDTECVKGLIVAMILVTADPIILRTQQTICYADEKIKI